MRKRRSSENTGIIWAAAALLYLCLQLQSGDPLPCYTLAVECCPDGSFPSPCPFWPWGEMASCYCQSLGAFPLLLVPLTLFIPQ